jgi:outer membrane usher protein
MGRLKRQRGWWRRTSTGWVILIALALASPCAEAETPDSAQVQLQLDVHVNGYPLNLIAAFVEMPDGRIGSPRSELRDLGIAVPGEGPDDEIIVLDSLKGVSYVYDDANQSIEIELPDAARLAKDIKVGGDSGETPEATSGTGMVVNYSLYGSAGYDIPNSLAAVDGASLSLDARAFSKFGTLRQTGIIGTTTFSDFTALRLDTTWSYSSPQSMRTYRIGDIVSGGLAWTRPIRMGGAQAARNFGLRPDLVTMPLPQFSGSAEVPSTLKVFIGGIEAYSGDVPPGPFRLDNLPVYTTSGTARVVVTDATGREHETSQEFYTSPDLLKQGLLDYSFDLGVVRRDFGTKSFGYDGSPVGVASMRYGLTNFLTLEGHSEASETLAEGGIGALFQAGRYGTLNGALAASLYHGDTGLFVHAGWQGHWGDVSASLTSQRTFGHFNDLAAVTERPAAGEPFTSGVPKALDQVSVNYGIRALKAGVGASFIHRVAADDRRSLIASGTYSQNFSHDITGYVTGFVDFGDAKDYGVFGGISMPLGGGVSSSAGVTAGKSGWSAGVEASHPSSGAPDSYSWRVAHSEGDQSSSTASGSYRASKARVEANLSQNGSKVSGNAAVDGSVVMAGDGVFFGNAIWDSFAIVDAGAPGVPVTYENRYAGTTGTDGKLLLPDLRAYQRNKVAIDVTNLPLGADISESEAIVVPREMSGVVVDFGVKADGDAAVVTLHDAAGKVIPAGSEVLLDGQSDSFVVGYDGEVYLTGLTAQNSITVKAGGNQCRASFPYAPDNQTVTTIGPVQCL